MQSGGPRICARPPLKVVCFLKQACCCPELAAYMAATSQDSQAPLRGSVDGKKDDERDDESKFLLNVLCPSVFDFRRLPR